MRNTSLETMAMMEKQQEKLHVCENNWVRRIAGVKKNRQAKNGGAEEVGVEESHKEVGVEESRKEVGVEESHKEVGVEESHKEVGVEESHKEVGVEEAHKEVGVEESHKEVGVEESHEEAGEEPTEVRWTCGKNGMGTVDKKSRYA